MATEQQGEVKKTEKRKKRIKKEKAEMGMEIKRESPVSVGLQQLPDSSCFQLNQISSEHEGKLQQTHGSPFSVLHHSYFCIMAIIYVCR